MEKYIYFNDIFQDYTKYSLKIPKNMYLKSGLYPIIDQGKEEIAGFSNQSTDIFNDVPIIIFGDHTRIFKYIDYPFFLGADGVKILKNISNLFLDKFLYYSIKNFKIPNTGYNRHFKWLKNFKIKYISLVEQRKIVNIIEKIEGFILQKKEQLNYLKKLNKSLFTTMFGDIKTNDKNWEIKKLKELVEIKSFIINENLSSIWLLNLEDIEPNTGKLIKKREVSFKNIPSSTISFNENYVLYSKLRPYLNKVFLPDEKGFGTSELVPLLPKKNIHKIFLTECLRNDKIVDFLSQKVSGAKMPRIIMKEFQDLNLIFPPIELQNKFAERIEKIEKLKFTIMPIILIAYENMKKKGVEKD